MRDAVRIAYVAALWGPAYPTGSGIYAFELAKKFVEHGHEVHVFTSTIGSFDGHQYPDGLHIHRLKTHGMALNMNPLSNAFFKLVGEGFDIVHAHSYLFFLSNSVALANLLQPFKYVLTFHGGVDHDGISHNSTSSRFWLKDWVYDPTIGRLTVRRADKLLSICKKDIPIISEKFGVDAEYVPNAVSTTDFSYRREDSREVSYVGKLESWKGVHDLGKIFKIVHEKHPEVKLKVVGNGSLLNSLKNTNLPIETAGYMPHDMMPDVYHSSSVSILPSYMEGAPTTCMEALSCGVPVVATDVGDTKEIVKDGSGGFIHSPGDIKGMADSVVRLIEDDSLRENMGVNGRKRIMDNYSYDAVFNQTLKVYESLIAADQGAKPRKDPAVHNLEAEATDTRRG